MESELIALIPDRTGHFQLESGHHGERWLDLDALFLRPRWLEPFVAALAERLAVHGVEVVCGPLVGGAFIAEGIAAALDVTFVYAERIVDTDPAAPGVVDYRVPTGLRDVVAGRRVAVVDDAINAGFAVRGTIADLRRSGAEVVAIGALLTLGDAASRYAAAQSLPLATIATLPNIIWEPAACPLCAAGVPLEDLSCDTMPATVEESPWSRPS